MDDFVEEWRYNCKVVEFKHSHKTIDFSLLPSLDLHLPPALHLPAWSSNDLLPGHPVQVQLGPQEQTSPHVQVPLALAGQDAPSADLPQVPGQSAQRQVSPHWQLSPQVPGDH